MVKKRISIFLDTEHIDALKNLKNILPVDSSINDSALIRYALLELLEEKTKGKLKNNELTFLLKDNLIYLNSIAESLDCSIFNLNQSELYAEVVSQRRKKIRAISKTSSKNRNKKESKNLVSDDTTETIIQTNEMENVEKRYKELTNSILNNEK